MTACDQCQTPLPEGARFCSSCGAAVRHTPVPSTPSPAVPVAAVEIVPGLTVVSGRYRVQALLGQGGMGAVYKCNDLALGEPVALKFLLGSFASDPKMIERFMHELKTVRRIQHKAIVPNFDMGEWQSLRYIVMQYIDGKSLALIMQERRKLPLEEALPLIAQIVSGLKAAHDEGVVHRDLKTDNILVDAKGNAYILDFGIARKTDSVRLTTSGEVLGSPLYIAPEQAQGQDVDHRADIYSLGVILFEILTGDVPFNGDDALAVALKHVMSPVPSPRERLPTLPLHVERAVMRCLAKKPEDRYDDVTQLLTDLLRISTSMTPVAAAAAAPAGSGKPAPSPTATASGDELDRVTPMASRNSKVEMVRPRNTAPAPRVADDGSRKLLVIDSDEGQILTLRRELTREKITVISTPNGQSGAEIAFRENPDAIIINARAPVIDGITFTQIIRGNPKLRNTPIFILCDRPDPSIIALQKPLRISGFVVRPLESADLMHRLHEVWQAA